MQAIKLIPLPRVATIYFKRLYASPAVQKHAFKMRSKKVFEKQKQIIDSINIENQHDVLSDSVTPYWKISYEEELKIKQQQCEDIINYYFEKIGRKNVDIKKIVKDIIPSPVRDAYRSKDEFSVYPGLDGNPKTVGFFVGSPAVGKVVCVPPTNLKCIRQSHKEIVQLYQDFLRSSQLPVSYQLNDGGFWRNIVIRSNDTGDHMALIISNPAGYTQEQIKEQQELLKDYFSQKLPELSLFHQSCPHVKCTREQAPICLLQGQSHMIVTMSGYKFRISPDSFFQMNKPAAELMFETVLKEANLKHFTTLLDLYCGTGILSVLASKYIRGSIGLEEVSSAVEDATYNAGMNDATNCKFIAGRVETMLERVLHDLEYSSNIIAILNPGRDGSGEGVMSLVRRNPVIQRLIYISCKPDNPVTMKNFVQLSQKIGPYSKSFSLKKVVPVDLFPYTSHFEVIMVFDKIK